MQKLDGLKLACFVTPHGFGHAARNAAVLEAMRGQVSELEVELYTSVPRWFFEDSLTFPFGYHEVVCDVGLVQKDAVTEDVPQTVKRLEALVPFRRDVIGPLADSVQAAGCQAVMVDIAPLGLEVARVAGVPSILVESFTWDWIYQAYGDEDPRILELGAELAEVFSRADLRVQTRPLCQVVPGCHQTGPVCRRIRVGRAEVRRKLGVSDEEKLVLATMGGIGWRSHWEEIRLPTGVTMVMPGGTAAEEKLSIITLPHRSGFQHADLLAACDGVIGKLGYSTVSEAYQAGVPFAYLARRRFPETEVLAAFASSELGGVQVAGEALRTGRLEEPIESLLAIPRRPPPAVLGADEAASKVLGWLNATGR